MNSHTVYPGVCTCGANRVALATAASDCECETSASLLFPCPSERELSGFISLSVWFRSRSVEQSGDGARILSRDHSANGQPSLEKPLPGHQIPSYFSFSKNFFSFGKEPISYNFSEVIISICNVTMLPV